MEIELKISKIQQRFLSSTKRNCLILGGRGCLRGDTLISTPHGPTRIDFLWNNEGSLVTTPLGHFPCYAGHHGFDYLIYIEHSNGLIAATSNHRVFSSSGWTTFGQLLEQYSSCRVLSTEDICQSVHVLNEQNSSQTTASCQDDCLKYSYQYDEQPHLLLNTFPISSPLSTCVPKHNFRYKHWDDEEHIHIYNCQQRKNHLSKKDFYYQPNEEQNVEHLFYDNEYASLHSHKHDTSSHCEFFEKYKYPLLGKEPLLFQGQSSQIQPFDEFSQYLDSKLFSLSQSSKKYYIRKIWRSNKKEEYFDLCVPYADCYLLNDKTCHHNSGKTHALALYVLHAAQKGKNGRALVGANNPEQVHQVVVPKIMSVLDSVGIDYAWGSNPVWYNSSFPHHNNILSIENGYQLICRSMFEYDRSTRGLEVSDLILDEIRDMEQEAIDVAQACLRGFGENYWVRAVSTPNGRDHIFKKWISHPPPDTEVITGSSSENPWLPKSFVQGLREQYSDLLYQQEVLGQIVDLNIGRVYQFDHKQHIAETPKEEPKVIVFSLDFNVQPMGGVLLYWNPEKKYFYQFDEVYIRTDATTEEACKQAMEKIEKCKYPKLPLWFMGDEAGSARSTKGVSDIQLMKNFLKGRCLNDGSKPRIIDRINSVNSGLCNVDKQIRLQFSPSCSQTIMDMETLQWKEDRRETDKSDIERSHWSEALGYVVYRLMPVKGRIISGFYTGD